MNIPSREGIFIFFFLGSLGKDTCALNKVWRIITKALAIENYGKKPNFLDFPKPKINNDEVLVEIYATSINPLDQKFELWITYIHSNNSQ